MSHPKVYCARGDMNITLSHLPLDKVAAITPTIFSDAFSWMKSLYFDINILLEIVTEGPIDNSPGLV